VLLVLRLALRFVLDLVPGCAHVFVLLSSVNVTMPLHTHIRAHPNFSASEMTYIVSGGALNSTHSLTQNLQLYSNINGELIPETISQHKE